MKEYLFFIIPMVVFILLMSFPINELLNRKK